jgi:hypothetical protein
MTRADAETFRPFIAKVVRGDRRAQAPQTLTAET